MHSIRQTFLHSTVTAKVTILLRNLAKSIEMTMKFFRLGIAFEKHFARRTNDDADVSIDRWTQADFALGQRPFHFRCARCSFHLNVCRFCACRVPAATVADVDDDDRAKGKRTNESV